ncbi:DJ-1/PfpI family protein [Alkalicoccus daliensis]|uniref:DJ-1/PfpI family protein n=1 Tax=Alkalicoccus daliensis TaxID=745820 RepID=A0A1H0GV33_9BACI|nr:DJ-1/PfpI family protein [Alkalicoccus daliensis]SDO10652.1 DJ-1/PfpI family protein [Alkalicoccus daliensis]
MKKKTVGIYLFDEVEVLDFAGPYEVFSAAELEDGTKPFQVVTLSETGGLIAARNGLRVETEKAMQAAPELDILIIPGGYGATSAEIHKKDVISFIQAQEKKTDMIASVCTGSYLLAEAGLLNGRKAATHWKDIEEMEKKYPEVQMKRNVKFVDEGHILTSAGISAGIELSLHMVKKVLGEEVMKNTAKHMEYDMQTSEN